MVMRTRPVPPALLVSLVFAALACSDPSGGPCEGAACDEPDAGALVTDAGRPDAGPTPGKCVPSCAGDKPVCDFATGTCITCTETRGCESRDTPACDTTVPGGACVECLRDEHCDGTRCDVVARRCAAKPDAGAQDAGSPDAGAADAGSPDAGCSPSLICDPMCGPGLTCIAGLCKPSQGCGTVECPRGFRCVGGQCALNGDDSPIQVTIRWKGDVDVDLHVVEPVGGTATTSPTSTCEIYYGNLDGCAGVLDLDSNAGCSIDRINVENVIYPVAMPTCTAATAATDCVSGVCGASNSCLCTGPQDCDSGACDLLTGACTVSTGTYKVFADYFDACNRTTSVPFEVIARVNGVETGYCGQFRASDADAANLCDGTGKCRQVMTFAVP
jgi:hypothetical protein